MLGFLLSCLTAWGGVRTVWVQGKGRERKGKGGNRRNRKGTEGKARERKGKEGKGRERKGVAGNGWGEEAAGDERAWLRGRLQTANGWGEEAAGDQRACLRGRLRTAWLQGSGWKWVGRRSRWG